MVYWVEYRNPAGKIIGKKETSHTEDISKARSKIVSRIKGNPELVGALYLSKNSRYPIGIIFYYPGYNSHIWSNYKTKDILYTVDVAGHIKEFLRRRGI